MWKILKRREEMKRLLFMLQMFSLLLIITGCARENYSEGTNPSLVDVGFSKVGYAPLRYGFTDTYVGFYGPVTVNLSLIEDQELGPVIEISSSNEDVYEMSMYREYKNGSVSCIKISGNDALEENKLFFSGQSVEECSEIKEKLLVYRDGYSEQFQVLLQNFELSTEESIPKQIAH